MTTPRTSFRFDDETLAKLDADRASANRGGRAISRSEWVRRLIMNAGISHDHGADIWSRTDLGICDDDPEGRETEPHGRSIDCVNWRPVKVRASGPAGPRASRPVTRLPNRIPPLARREVTTRFKG